MRKQLLITRRLTVPLDRSGEGIDSFRIAHISDFHLPMRNGLMEATSSALQDLDYDLLVATGDFGHRPRSWDAARTQLEAFFKPFQDGKPILGVLGNHDDPAWKSDPAFPIRILTNESVVARNAKSRIVVVGVDQSSPDAEDIAGALRGCKPSDVAILLAHYPSTALRLTPGSVDLMLSGHTHGGQIRLPYLGCLWTNDTIPRRMAQGLHRINATLVHTSPGIGTSGPIRLRIGCPPEITLLTLQCSTASLPNKAPQTADHRCKRLPVSSSG